MRALTTLIGLLVIPLGIFNMLGGIVAGVWLIILGDWSPIFLSLLFIVAGTFLVSIFMIPSIGLAIGAAHQIERGRKAIGLSLLFASNVYIILLQSVWAVAASFAFSRTYVPGNGVPVWILSFGAATGVWTWMASKEAQSDPNSFAGVAVFFLQLGYIAASVLVLLYGWSPKSALPVFAMFCAVPLLFFPAVAAAITRRS